MALHSQFIKKQQEIGKKSGLQRSKIFSWTDKYNFFYVCKHDGTFFSIGHETLWVRTLPSACSADCDQESGFHRIQYQFRNFESEILRSFRPIRRILDPCNRVKFILNEPYQNFHVSAFAHFHDHFFVVDFNNNLIVVKITHKLIVVTIVTWKSTIFDR